LDFKNIHIAIYFVILFFSSALHSEEINYENYFNKFGLKASNISGYGFYYNRKIDNDFQIQVMGLIFYYFNNKENNEYKNFNYDFGLEIQRNMIIFESSRLYVLMGAYYYYDDVNEKNIDLNKNITNNSFNIGVGLGYEIFYKRFVLSCELGYKYFEDNLEIAEINKPVYPKRDRVTKVGAGIGLGFTF